ncbi:hypothetical protein IIA79_06230, partial [bacterium]|nr:hypothetical protein [bacterium]
LGLPVDIYGRTNRIRPWESGINYFALAQYLGNRESWGYFDYFTQPRPRRAAAVAPEGARLLVLTRDNHYREVTGLDERLRALGQSEITAWDIGLPISHQDLRQALLDGSAALRGGVHGGGPDLVGRAAVPAIIESRTGPSAPPTGQPAPPKLRIPYFYLDRGVRGGLDRRTFKDREFWEGGEMTQLLADYKAAGGQVIDEDSLEITLADDEAVALKVLVVLYPRTFTWEMGEADIARFQQEIAGWVRWYDEVAGDKLHLELDFLQVGRRLPPLASGPRGGEVYWMSWTDVEDDLLARGVPRDYYDSVACFWAWDREAAVENGGTAQQAYGGAAEGPDSDMEFLGGAGRASYFGSAVLKSHPDNVSKVAIHEYLHNLGAMFKSAGLGDRFLSSDDMARNMDKLLAERPGSFEAHGYSDDGMRVLAKKEQRKEDSFPWRTQLIYYRWMLERTAKNDYARLLTRFGKRQPRTPRQRLYNKHLLPEGDDEPYQVWFAEPAAWPEHVSSMRIELLDKDRDDGYVHWRSVAWVGTTAGPGSGAVERYREAELIAPDSIEITLGEGAPKLAVSLDGVDAGQDTSGVQVWAEIGGQRVDLASSGNGGYAAPLPGGIGEPAQITFHAEAYGFVISPLPVELIVRPSWDLAVEFRESSEEEGGLALTVDGPSGGYTLELELATELNSVLARLAVDGLVGPKVEYRTTLRLTPGKEVLIVLDAESLDALKAAGGTVTVEYESPSGESMSFAHRLPALKSTGDLLGKLSEDDLPPYIPRAVRLTPVIDGELGEWPADPAITLTPANGNVFSGSFEREGDAEIELWLAYDDERFYAAGKVRDDMTPGNGIWDSDRLNFCFDARLDSSSATYPGGPVGHTGWEADDYWIFLCPMLADGPKSMCLGGARPTGGRVGYYGPLGDAQAVVVAEDGGYRFEWAIPWASLPHLPPAEGQFTGFTFFLSDYDESLSEVMHVTDWGGPGGIEWRFWDCGLLYFAE